MCKMRFKSEQNNNKSNTQKQNKNGGGEQDKSNETGFELIQKHEKVLLLWLSNAYVKSL